MTSLPEAPDTSRLGAGEGHGLARNATVGNHITSIFAKLQAASGAEAIIQAGSAGLGDH